MKNYIIILIPFLFFSLTTLQAQKATKEVLTKEFSVKGNCKMCKVRIENAAYIKGVKSAVWDQETHKITVIYRADKVTLEQIQSAIASKGHATETQKAVPEAYQNLPKCCQYETEKCEH
ncbi:MAG: metal transporter [Bacteroidia bacterium]|nr:metal transporter [Bacteroidia bacterium]